DRIEVLGDDQQLVADPGGQPSGDELIGQFGADAGADQLGTVPRGIAQVAVSPHASRPSPGSPPSYSGRSALAGAGLGCSPTAALTVSWSGSSASVGMRSRRARAGDSSIGTGPRKSTAAVIKSAVRTPSHWPSAPATRPPIGSTPQDTNRTVAMTRASNSGGTATCRWVRATTLNTTVAAARPRLPITNSASAGPRVAPEMTTAKIGATIIAPTAARAEPAERTTLGARLAPTSPPAPADAIRTPTTPAGSCKVRTRNSEDSAPTAAPVKLRLAAASVIGPTSGSRRTKRKPSWTCATRPPVARDPAWSGTAGRLIRQKAENR